MVQGKGVAQSRTGRCVQLAGAVDEWEGVVGHDTHGRLASRPRTGRQGRGGAQTGVHRRSASQGGGTARYFLLQRTPARHSRDAVNTRTAPAWMPAVSPIHHTCTCVHAPGLGVHTREMERAEELQPRGKERSDMGRVSHPWMAQMGCVYLTVAMVRS